MSRDVFPATEYGTEVGKFMSGIRLHVYGSGVAAGLRSEAGKAERKNKKGERERERKRAVQGEAISRDGMKRFSSWSRRWCYQKLNMP